MSGIDPDFICHRLSITFGMWLMCQKKRRLGDKKRWTAKEETTKILQACFVRGDLYLLLNIDGVVDGAFGCGLLSFMDAYLGYNQIKMHSSDETKTTFIIDEDNFCYRIEECRADVPKVMNRIGHQLEVYVDNMVVKSDTESQHVEALTSIFLVLREHQLKLNPNKCSFGVKVENFLDFMLTKQGIEANPEKCEVVIKMSSPKNVKEV
ncbi:Retrovirus-related Pol polyprotein from transposon 17.6, partial [Mucuna pruriens]